MVSKSISAYLHPIIDAHTHFFPERLFNTIWNYFENNYWSICQKGTSVNLAQSLINDYNIEKFFVLNYAHKKGIANELNKWTYEFCNHRDRKGSAIPFLS